VVRRTTDDGKKGQIMDGRMWRKNPISSLSFFASRSVGYIYSSLTPCLYGRWIPYYVRAKQDLR